MRADSHESIEKKGAALKTKQNVENKGFTVFALANQWGGHGSEKTCWTISVFD